MEFGSRRDPKMEPAKKPATQAGEDLQSSPSVSRTGRAAVELPAPGSELSRAEKTMAWVKENVTLNADYQPSPVYVVREGNGYSCHGFDVVEDLTKRYAGWLGEDPPASEKGTLEAYAAYREIVQEVVDKCHREKTRCTVELTPQLVGLEGKRVEVVDRHGEKRRFWVGKSTGDIPIHIEINNTRSMGGPAVMGAPFNSVTVVRESR